MGMHGERVKPALGIRKVKLGFENLLLLLGVRQRAFTRVLPKVGNIVADRIDGKLDHSRRMPIEQDFVSVVPRQQGTVVEKTRVLNLLHRILAELPGGRFGQRLLAEDGKGVHG